MLTRQILNNVLYEPGTLKVVALDKNGIKTAEKTVKTAGKPHKIKLEADRTTLKANGKDLAFVTVSVVDKNGIPCPTATNELAFKVSGKGSFKAVCNGDPTSLTSFYASQMKLFSGKLVVLVESTDKAGTMELKVTGNKLQNASLEIKTSN